MEPLREVVRDFLERGIREGRLGLRHAEPLLRVLLDGFHGALVAVAHDADRTKRDGSSRQGFLAVARLVCDSLLGSKP